MCIAYKKLSLNRKSAQQLSKYFTSLLKIVSMQCSALIYRIGMCTRKWYAISIIILPFTQRNALRSIKLLLLKFCPVSLKSLLWIKCSINCKNRSQTLGIFPQKSDFWRFSDPPVDLGNFWGFLASSFFVKLLLYIWSCEAKSYENALNFE